MSMIINSRVLKALVLVLAMLANLVTLPMTPAYAADEYDTLRAKIYDFTTGGSTYDPADPDISVKVTNITTTAQTHWDSMNKSPGRTYLWSDMATTTESEHVSGSYQRLEAMTLAYVTRGSTLQNNSALLADIISAMDWMYANRYNTSVPKRGYDNWFDWQVTSPLVINNITIWLYSSLTATQISNWHAVIDYQALQWGAGLTGANRVWACNIKITSGIIVKNSAKIIEGRDQLSSVFDYVTSGEGIYSDGSFTQHTALIPNNGGYGVNLLDNLTKVMYIIAGSSWDITDPDVNNIYQWIYNAFEPLFYNDSMFDLVRGRNIARLASDDMGLTSMGALGASVARMALSAPSASDRAAYKSMIKKWMLEATSPTKYADLVMISSIVQTKQIMNDPTVTPRAPLIMNKQYPNMARAVHHRPGFAFGVSMSSDKIANFEIVNNENLRGWHTGDGMTYLYNSDLSQYKDSFWATVNSYRLPGTTVIQNSTAGANAKNPNIWVGGTEISGLYGVTGMQYTAIGYNLTAKKSWFMFDDEIVSLGAGITSTDNKVVETIVENRKLNNSGNNALNVNGTAKSTTLGWSETMTGVNWIHLAGNVAGSDIGYYFPTAATINGLRESRTDQWSSINQYYKGPDYTTDYTRNYMNLWFDHGTNPTEGTYNYVLLPGKTSEEVGRYSNNPDVEVMANTGNVQAVRENKLGLLGINFWQDAVNTVGGVTSDKKASVMIRSGEDGTEISVSDPTMSNTGTIHLSLDFELGSLASIDPGISVASAGGTTQLIVNVNGALGKSMKVRFNKPGVPSAGPSAPTGLIASENTANSIQLNWNDVEGATDYRLYRAETQGGTFLSITNLLPGATAYTDTNLKSGTQYIYKVSALNPSGMSVESEPISTWTVPISPVGLNVVSVADTANSLSWQAVSGAAGYMLYRSESQIGPFLQVNSDPITSLTYMDSDIHSGINYYYRIAAMNEGGVSQSSSAIPTLFGIPAELMHENFNNMVVGDLNGQNGWVSDNGGVAGNTVTVQAGSGTDKSVKVKTVSTQGKAEAYKLFNAPQGSTIIVESTVVADDSNWKNALVVADSRLTSNGSGVHLILQNRKIWGYNGGTQTDIMTSTTNGTSYRLKAVINTATKKFDVYVNDELRASQWSYRYSGVSRLDKLSTSIAGNASSMSMDDVKISYMLKAPGNVQAKALSASSIGLSWSASPGAAEYRIYRSTSPENGFELISGAGLTGLTYTDENLSGIKKYYYKVVAVHQQAVSSESVTVSSTTFPLPDTTAPVTASKISGTANAAGWYRQDVTVTLSVYDTDSGAVGTQYKLNDGAWTNYASPVTISSEGENTLQFYSKDLAGNAETVRTLSIPLDKTAPVLVVSQSGQSVHDVLLLDEIQLALTASDSVSGVASRSLRLDGKTLDIVDSIPAVQLGLGPHTVEAVGEDAAGNTSKQTWTFKVNVDFPTFHVWLSKLLQEGEMKNSGTLSSLEADLSQAESQLEKGHQDQAVKHLNDLVKKIDTFKDNGNLSPKAADDLKAAFLYYIAAGLM